MNTTNLNSYINQMSNQQQIMLELFLHTMQKEKIHGLMHGEHTAEDFEPELIFKLSRILDNMHTGHMEEARTVYQAAAALVTADHDDADTLWNEISIISALYLLGYEEGIRSERLRRKGSK